MSDSNQTRQPKNEREKSRTKKSRRIVQRWARQRKQKELEWETRIQKTYDNNINQQKSSFNQLMLKKFGFIANASKPRWENTQQALLQMPAEHYFNHQNNIAIHNLCKSTKEIPPGAISLLGLGLNFCIKHRYPTHKIKKSIKRFQNDIRTKQLFVGLKRQDNFIPQLYIEDPHWITPPAKPKIEHCLQRFATRFQAEQKKYFLSCNNIYHYTYYSKKNIWSLQVAVRQFMTECFINHESCSIRLHVGPSFGDHARVSVLHFESDHILVLMLQRVWHL